MKKKKKCKLISPTSNPKNPVPNSKLPNSPGMNTLLNFQNANPARQFFTRSAIVANWWVHVNVSYLPKSSKQEANAQLD